MTKENDTDLIERRVQAKMVDSIKRLAVVTGIAATSVTLLGAWVTFPHRLNAVEKSIERITAERGGDHEALIRIETMLIDIQRRIEKIEKKSGQ